MNRRQGATSDVVIGSFNQRTKPCQAVASRPGPTSAGSDRLGDCSTEGMSQYERDSVRGCLAPMPEDCLSVGSGVMVNFSSAPSCSWNLSSVFKRPRANQIAA